MQDGPIAVGGVGGSGTRLVAQILTNAGYYLGADRNETGDTLWFTLLLKRPRWLREAVRRDDPSIGHGLDILGRALTGRFRPTVADLRYVAAATYDLGRNGHNGRGDGKGRWALERARSLLAAPAPPADARGWGWKEPTTHVVLPQVHERYPEARYIHVIRHGLDMAFSRNQQDLLLAPLLGVAAERPSPAWALRYWLAANETAIARAPQLFGDRFLLLNFDALRRDPLAALETLTKFLELDPDVIDLERVVSWLQLPPSARQYTHDDLSLFEPRDLDRLERLGFDVVPAAVRFSETFRTRPRSRPVATALRLSVALCTYNGARYLAEQLESIARQTRLPDELVVCDDGSSDGTLGLLEEFQDAAPFPVRLERNEQRLGSTKNFEKAIGLTTGDVVLLCDQDDIWLPMKLARLAQLFAERPTLGAVFTDGLLVDDRSRTIPHRLWESLGITPWLRDYYARSSRKQRIYILFHGNLMTGAAMAFRGEFRELVVPIPGDWVQDAWIGMVLSAVTDVAMLEQPLIRYRVHGGQQIGIGGAHGLTAGSHLLRPVEGTSSVIARFEGTFRSFDFVRHVLNKVEQGMRRTEVIRRMRKQERSLLARRARVYRDLYDRFRRFQDRWPCPPDVLAILAPQIRHLETRAAMDRIENRWSVVLEELRSGRYHRYSNGLSSAAKDLLLLDRLLNRDAGTDAQA